MIFSTFAPNIERDDIILTLKLIMPWNWHKLKNGKHQELLKETIATHFKKNCLLFDSGRNALYQLLKAYKFDVDSEIIIQALTCSVVPHAIKRARLKPIYCDITNEYNLDPQKLSKLITENTKAVIIQHTFGIPAQINEIQEVCKKHNLILIEDLAISLGTKYKKTEVGNFGESAFLSFGSAKTISCSRGGAVITSNQDLYHEMQLQTHETGFAPPLKLIIPNLIQPLIFYIAKPIYNKLKLGKIILFICKKIKILPTVITNNEKSATGNPQTYHLANCLAAQTLHQWHKLPKFIAHRKALTKTYNNFFKTNFPTNYSLLNYPILTKNRTKIINKAKKTGIILDNWYQNPIAPADANNESCDYQKGMCPQAELICKELIVLPTHINITNKNANKIISCFPQN